MIKNESPTRIDLAGGTLDCWPLHLFVGNCKTVNLAIDILTGCELTVRPDEQIEVVISDLKWEATFSSLSEFMKSAANELRLVQKVIEYFQPTFGFRLKTFSQSPVGGGLGGSSSLCISLIKSFLQAVGQRMNKYEMVQLAHNIEAKVINAPTGTQDYFPAITGGLNIINYTARGIQADVLDVPLTFLHENILLIYTGRSHHSGINNWQVIKSVIDGDSRTLEILREIALIAEDTALACLQQDWHKLSGLFRAEYDARVRLTPVFSSPEIEQLKKISTESGAEAVKICGAGGGGCVLILAEPLAHERIESACLKSGFQILKARPVAAF